MEEKYDKLFSGNGDFFKLPFSCAVRKLQNTALLSFQQRVGKCLETATLGGWQRRRPVYCGEDLVGRQSPEYN